MRILFDAYWWISGPPSGRNAVQGIVEAWVHTFPADHVCLQVRPRDKARVESDLMARGLSLELRTASRWARVHALSAIFGRHRANKYDASIWQNFGPLLPVGIRCVLLHDVLFVEHPEWFSPLERWYLRLIRPSLKNAPIIFSTSMSETRRIAETWGELRKKIVPVGLGVPLGVQRATPEPVVGYGSRPEFVLTVGRLNIRKNISRLIEAFALSQACKSGSHALYIVGERDGLGEELGERVQSEIGRSVFFLGAVTDAQLSWLYTAAALFVFPSLDEGFGLPLVEAAYFETTAIASDIPVFRELGTAAGYFDPESTAGIANAIDNAVTTTIPRQAFPGTYQWSETVSRMRSSIDSALSHDKKA